MILPTKRISENRALLSIGGEIILLLNKEKNVSRLWDELKKKREQNNMKSPITFDWFVLSLDLLYMMKIIELDEGIIRRIAS